MWCNLKYKTIILFIIFNAACLYSFSVQDIPEISSVCHKANVAQFIKENIEPFSKYWIKNWQYPIPKDSIRNRIIQVLHYVDEDRLCGSQTTPLLLKSLLWHYLYQLEVDSAYNKADSLTLHLMVEYPQLTEAAWLHGINLVRGSKIIQGFKILDSLRICRSISNTTFLNDFRELSTLCFLPPRIEMIDSILVIGNKKARVWHPSLEDSELVAQSNSWRVLERMSNKKEFPLFVFDGDYKLKPPVLLRNFPAPPLKLKMDLDNQHFEKVLDPLIFEYERSPCLAHMEIVADVSDAKVDLVDYLRTVIDGKYDAVRIAGDIKPLNGISVRCYKISIYRDLPGKFDAYAVFDTRISNRRQDLFYCKDKKGNSYIGVRYLVSMKCSSEVEDKAELIYQNMIDHFKNWRTLD